MDLELREKRRRGAERESRKRAVVALVLAIAFHLTVVPLAVLVLSVRGAQPPEKSEVKFVRIPAAQWDATMGGANNGPAPTGPRPPQTAQQQPQPPKPEEQKKPEPEKPPGQVVKTAPGNGEEDPNAKLAAETSNRVEKEQLDRNRQQGNKVTMPRQTTNEKPPEPSQQKGQGDGLAVGADPGDGKDQKRGKAGTKAEIPSVEKQDKLALKEDPSGRGGFENREGTEKLQGNSDRLRLQVGEGEGSDADAGAGAPSGTRGGLKLFPSAATVDKIAGGAAPDHIDGMDEGDGTFLNTREWRFASFFNRLKDSVGDQWKPMDALRRRDPTGEIYAFKDRQTLLTVTLDDGGRVTDVFVAQSSGVDFLDREAIAAFERAQPFPNPPRGLVDERGQIKFQFGFYLQVGRGGLRIFR